MVSAVQASQRLTVWHLRAWLQACGDGMVVRLLLSTNEPIYCVRCVGGLPRTRTCEGWVEWSSSEAAGEAVGVLRKGFLYFIFFDIACHGTHREYQLIYVKMHTVACASFLAMFLFGGWRESLIYL